MHDVIGFGNRCGWWIASLWTALGLFDATQTVRRMRAEGMHHAWLRLFAVEVVSWLPWAFATPWVLQLAQRHPVELRKPSAAWLPHAAAGTAIAFAFSAWKAVLHVFVNPYADIPPPPFMPVLIDDFVNGICRQSCSTWAELDGFDVLERLGAELPAALVFVTAYESYALRAFDAGALDDLLKPFDDARFFRALARAKERIAQARIVRPKSETLVVKSAGRVAFVKLPDID